MYYVRQQFTDSSNTVRVASATLEGAEAVANLLTSEVEIFEDSKTIPATEPAAQDVQAYYVEVVLKNNVGLTTYMRFYAKVGTEINKLHELFKGKTINNVLVDEVIVTTFKLVA